MSSRERTEVAEVPSAALLCGRAARISQRDSEAALELYREAMGSGDPEWSPYAALMLGNSYAEAGELAEAEAAWRVAIASGHEVFAVSAAHHLGNLARQVEDEDEDDFDDVADGADVDDADARWAAENAEFTRIVRAYHAARAATHVIPLPPAAAGPRGSRAPILAAVGVLCLASAGIAHGLAQDAADDREALLTGGQRVDGVVVEERGKLMVRYLTYGTPVLTDFGDRRPDGTERGWVAGQPMELVDYDGAPGGNVVLVEDLVHPEEPYPRGASILIAVVGAGALIGAVRSQSRTLRR